MSEIKTWNGWVNDAKKLKNCEIYAINIGNN